MESRKHREFKLAVPLQFEITSSEITILDKFENVNSIPLNPSVVFKISNPDDDGYVLFDISYLEHKQAKQTFLSQTEAHVNGFTLFHTNLSNSFGYGGQKSVFEYYKRENDLSYYALVKKEGKRDRRIQLGSLRDTTSRIFQISRIINEKFGSSALFNKSELYTRLPPPLNGARIIKGTLDILAKEGYLTGENATSGKRNRPIEIFSKTDKLQKFMADPRSWQKPNGLNIGSSTMTSNQ